MSVKKDFVKNLTKKVLTLLKIYQSFSSSTKILKNSKNSTKIYIKIIKNGKKARPKMPSNAVIATGKQISTNSTFYKKL